MAEHQAAQLGVLALIAGAQIGDPTALVGDVLQPAVEAGPALGLDFLLQGRADLLLTTWPQLQGHALSGTIAEAPANIGAADDQILPVIGLAADQHMDMRVVGVPVIDRDPIQLGVEVALGVRHERAREAAQILQFHRVFRRDDESEMVPVVGAALGEGALIGGVRVRIEHARLLPVAGDAVALQVAHVLGQRGRAETRALMAHHARLDHDAPGGRALCQGQRHTPASAEGRSLLGAAEPAEIPAGVTRLLRGPHHLADEAGRSLAAAVAVLDAAGPNPQFVVTNGHGRGPPRDGG